MRKLLKRTVSVLISMFALGSAQAEVTDAQLTKMVNEERFVFHVNRPANPPREVEVVFDQNGFHVFDQGSEIVSRGWIEIERVSMNGILIVTQFKSEADFAVPRAELKYQSYVDYFLVFALQQIVNARISKD